MPESTSDPRVVLITGANGGLGTAVTNAFLKAGVAIVGVSRKITDTEFRTSQEYLRTSRSEKKPVQSWIR